MAGKMRAKFAGALDFSILFASTYRRTEEKNTHREHDDAIDLRDDRRRAASTTDDAAELGGQPLRATKILLNGVDIAAQCCDGNTCKRRTSGSNVWWRRALSPDAIV